jgi:hypothetical protein
VNVANRILSILGAFVMAEIAIASVATLMAVCVIHVSGRWMFAAPVPIWLLKLTRMANQNKKHKKSSAIHLAQVRYFHNCFQFPRKSYCIWRVFWMTIRVAILDCGAEVPKVRFVGNSLVVGVSDVHGWVRDFLSVGQAGPNFCGMPCWVEIFLAG